MNPRVRLAGITWEVVPAAAWPNVAWLEAVGHGAVLVYERHDGRLTLSRDLVPRTRPHELDVMLRTVLAVPASSTERPATLRVVQ